MLTTTCLCPFCKTNTGSNSAALCSSGFCKKRTPKGEAPLPLLFVFFDGTYVWAIVFVGSGNLLRNGIRLDGQEVKIYGAPFFFSDVAVCTISQIKKVSDFFPLSRRKSARDVSEAHPELKLTRAASESDSGTRRRGGENWVRARGGGHKRCRCLFFSFRKRI